MRWRYQRYMHDYLACVEAVDESVGRVLEYLDDAGLADNTMVIYTSDQGFYLGEHGWFDKRWIFEESLRTPLLVRWPGVVKPGSVTTATSCRTWISLRRFSRWPACRFPPTMQGRSLVPVLAARRPADWRKSFYYHYYEWYPGRPHHVRPHYGVVTDRYKLVQFYGDVRLLGTVRSEKGSSRNSPASMTTRPMPRSESDCTPNSNASKNSTATRTPNCR